MESKSEYDQEANYNIQERRKRNHEEDREALGYRVQEYCYTTSYKNQQ